MFEEHLVLMHKLGFQLLVLSTKYLENTIFETKSDLMDMEIVPTIEIVFCFVSRE